MAPTNRQRVDQALHILKDALIPYFETQISASINTNAWAYATDGQNLDLTKLFNIFHEYRNDVFRPALGNAGLNLVHEMQATRNAWAHQEAFNTADTLRALDTTQRLLTLVGDVAGAEEIVKSHEQLLRTLCQEQARAESRKRTQNLKSQGSDALVPWREVAEPHHDVRTGTLKEAEFAADLERVYLGTASPEYQDPEEFFRRTYLTEGLTTLLVSAFNRLHGKGGDPVLELQTNFGGGKTHSMIALFHAASGRDPATLPGLEPLVQEAGIAEPLHVQRAVLVGTKLSPSEPRRKTKDVTVNTLWGELAWQLGGERGYRLVEQSDKSGLAPGAQVLQELFDFAGPSLILIDEWVAFMRPLWHVGDTPPVAGSFDANLTFAQNLTEAVAASEQVLLAASLPYSDLEVGGVGGERALDVLRHTFTRVKASWRAASTDESFEIVRRRLFQPITDLRRRDATIRMYLDMYQKAAGQFPTKVQEADYRKRMEAAYPFHPETFDVLFEVWGSLDRFQRTRGVLRLMANVVRTLWERDDRGPLIMPANIPLDAVGVVTEMGGYLPDSWTSVIEHDIDGEWALSLQLDRDNINFDRVSATRRVARTIFFGSVPTFRSENKGIDDRAIRLGVVQPGENAAIFGDALRTLADRATFLYSEHGRYWFSTQPSVTQLAQDRLAQLPQDDVDHAIVEALRKQQGQRGIFDRVHIAPASSGDVADTPEASLVVLGPSQPHIRGQHDANGGRASQAVTAAANILDVRGDGRRQYRNGLVFLAPDARELTNLRTAMADRIVWQEIAERHEEHNLDAQQLRQAKSRATEAERTVNARLRSAWQWLMAPWQAPEPGSPVQWDVQQVRAAEDESAAVAAGKRAQQEELVIARYAGSNVRRALEEIPAFRDGWPHVPVKDLATWYASYLYLPRLKNADVLREAIQQGAGSMTWQLDAFAYADAYDESTGRYRGLTAGTSGGSVVVNMHGDAVLVHPDVATRQLDADEAARLERERGAETPAAEAAPAHGIEQEGPAELGGSAASAATAEVERNPTRYFGSVTLNPQTVASQVREISQEVVSHMQSMYGAEVKLSLEIEVTVPDGIPADRRRIVDENTKALRFDQSDFSGT